MFVNVIFLASFFTTLECLGARVHTIQWESGNPLFRIDNTDHIIDVNRGNLPFEYDQVNIVCPYQRPDDTGTYEQHIIYSVSKEEYDSCRITDPNPRIIAVCDQPGKLLYFTITFRSFTPQPGGLEFRPGQDYYFISTSSDNDLHRRVGGRCQTNNMKVVFKVCCKKEKLAYDTIQESNSVYRFPASRSQPRQTQNPPSILRDVANSSPLLSVSNDEQTRFSPRFRYVTADSTASSTTVQVTTTFNSFTPTTSSSAIPPNFDDSENEVTAATFKPIRKSFGFPIFSIKTSPRKTEYIYRLENEVLHRASLKSSASSSRWRGSSSPFMSLISVILSSIFLLHLTNLILR